MNKRQLMRKLYGPKKLTVAAFWGDCMTKVVGCVCSMIIMAIILSATLPMDTERITEIVECVALVLALLCLLSILLMARYRLRDAGYTAKAYLWLLLPFVGWFIFIVLLCAKTKQTEGHR